MGKGRLVLVLAVRAVGRAIRRAVRRAVGLVSR